MLLVELIRVFFESFGAWKRYQSHFPVTICWKAVESRILRLKKDFVACFGLKIESEFWAWLTLKFIFFGFETCMRGLSQFSRKLHASNKLESIEILSWSIFVLFSKFWKICLVKNQGFGRLAVFWVIVKALEAENIFWKS